MFKAAIFDFNGTLFFDSDKTYEAWRRYLFPLIGRRCEDWELKEYMLGRNYEETFSYFLGKKLPHDELAELDSGLEDLYMQICLEDKENFHLAPGAVSFFKDLKSEDVPFTIATASLMKNMRFFFDHFDLYKWFDINKMVFNSGDIPGKPDPAIYLRACDRLSVEPAEAVVFEDAISGIISAQNANIGKIIVVDSTLTNKEIKKSGRVDKVIHDFKDMNVQALRNMF